MDLIAVLFLLWLGKNLVGKNSRPQPGTLRTQPVQENNTLLGSRMTVDPKLTAATHQFMSYFRQLPDNEQRAILARLNERQTKQFNHLGNQVAYLSEQQQLDLIQQQQRNGLYQELGQWAVSDGARIMNQANRWWSFRR